MTQSAVLAASGSPGTTTGFKNRIINGNMAINQRGFSGSITSGTNNVYTLDRWKAYISLNDKFTVSQNAGSVTPPTGFTKYLGATSSAATTPTSSGYYLLTQFIEGYNVADLNWGTANAQSVTLSFWVRSSLTGTFGGSLMNDNQDRSYPFTYTIASANTWTKATVTVPGDTTGTWATDNGTGLKVWFSLGTGSSFLGTAGAWAGATYFSATGETQVIATSGATLYITGVQLESGTTATNFDFRSIGTETALCQRYFYQIQGNNGGNTTLGMGFANSGSEVYAYLKLAVIMRSTPTLSGYSGLRVSDLNSYTITVTSADINAGNPNAINLYTATAGGLTTLRPHNTLLTNSSTAYVAFSAEL